MGTEGKSLPAVPIEKFIVNKEPPINKYHDWTFAQNTIEGE